MDIHMCKSRNFLQLAEKCLGIQATFPFVNQEGSPSEGFARCSGKFFGRYAHQKSSLQQLVGCLGRIVIAPLHRILVGPCGADYLTWCLRKAGLIHRADIGEIDDTAIQSHKVYSKSHGVGPC